MNPQVIGYVAATLSVAAFTPQVWKVIKTRETEGMSTSMWVLDTTAFAVWVAYGIAVDAWPIIIPNALCGLFAAFILVMNLVSHRTKDKIADVLDPSVRSGSM
ncbi:MAG: SemiSWEET family transporter [Polyangiales bacterium]